MLPDLPCVRRLHEQQRGAQPRLRAPAIGEQELELDVALCELAAWGHFEDLLLHELHRAFDDQAVVRLEVLLDGG